MPKIGNGIESLDDLKKDEYAWSKLQKGNSKDPKNIILINDDDIFYPWKLVFKK